MVPHSASFSTDWSCGEKKDGARLTPEAVIQVHSLSPEPNGLFPKRCRCQYQETPIPCPQNADTLLDQEFAPSWWVPFPVGGENINTDVLHRWGDPTSGERRSGFFMGKGGYHLEVLQRMDQTKDGEIDAADLKAYVAAQPRFNMPWYREQEGSDPCRLVNGGVHLNHTLWWFAAVDREINHEWVAGKAADLRQSYHGRRFEHDAALCRAVLRGGGGAPAATSTAPARATGPPEHGHTTSRSTGRGGQQNTATRRNMRREDRVTVQGPVKKQHPTECHTGGGGREHRPERARCGAWPPACGPGPADRTAAVVCGPCPDNTMRWTAHGCD